MKSNDKIKTGIVYIAGAGPGDPGLITVKGLEIIRSCDVILYDNLVNPDLLSEAKDECEKIFVGKEGGHHFVIQEDTIKLLIQKAKENKIVLRLKGGDPLTFARGAEEALALADEGIEFEIVPGITSGAAAAAYSGIPLTHRSTVTQTVFITAHESPDKPESQAEWEHLAKMKNTNLVIYMGASMIPKIVETLLSYGLDKDTPAALIENGTLPTQRTFTTKLYRVPDLLTANNIKPPLIFFIGPTVSLRENLKWFEKKPLFGKRIVATRAGDQANSLYKKLSALGAVVLPFKVIQTNFNDTGISLKELFDKNKFDWIIFSSENGVRYFVKALEQQKLDTRIFGFGKIAAIGTGTSDKLKSFGILPDFIPDRFTSQSLVEELPKCFDIINKNILRVKGNFKNDIITDTLSEIGAIVYPLEVYKIYNDKPNIRIVDNLIEYGADAFLFTSKSTVDNFFEDLGNETALRLLSESKVIAIGPVTVAALNSKGIDYIAESPVHTIDGMLETLINLKI